MSYYKINLHGLTLEVSVTHAYKHEPSSSVFSAASDWDAQGYTELEWSFTGGTDEAGETLSFRSLDFIADKYQSDIERAIWAQIEG